MKRQSLICILALGLACRSNDGASVRPTPETSDASLAPPKIAVTLDDASVIEVLNTLQRASHRDVHIDADAAPIAECARIDLHSGPVDAATLATTIGAAIWPSGLVLEAAPDGWVVHRAPDGPAPSPCRADAAPPGSAAAAPDQTKIARAIAGVRKVKEGSYELTEETRALLRDKRVELLRSVRIVPEMEDGGMRGMRLFGVRNGSVVAALGFENGDTLLALAGKPLDSPEATLAAIDAGQTAKNLTASILRRGQPLELAYRIVPQ